jgi:two-component system chemotaxis response regulator CheB
MNTLIRALIVDDSAFVRKVVREMLSRSPFIEVVGMARDGEEALALIPELKPDVITCDLMMPRMDGVEFVRRQMAIKALPILMLTASPEDSEHVMEAIEAGAVDLVQKPTALASDELKTIREELIEKVKAAAGAPMDKLGSARGAVARPVQARRASRVDIVAIGVSTGGPQALRYLLPQFPADFPVPVAIVLHMPVGYTAMFAEKLDEISTLKVREASSGGLLEPGTATLGQAGRHFALKRTAAGNVVAQLPAQPADKPHKPSVDVLFQSAAQVHGGRVLAVVLTGMGEDGKEGAAWVKARGGTVLTESEESCVIYGMPRSVKEAGLSDGSYPLNAMAEAISKYL